MTFMAQFEFDPHVFFQAGMETETGEWPDSWTDQIKSIGEVHPELRNWGGLAIGSAWGDFSQDVLAVSWVDSDWLSGHQPGFLAYIYVRQVAPAFKFGGTALFMSEVFELGAKAPWQGDDHQPPTWANLRQIS